MSSDPDMPGSAFARRWAGLVLAWRVPLLVFFALLAVPAGFLALRLPIDNSTDIWFAPGDPEFLRYRRFLAEFGSDRVFAVTLTHEDLFSPAGLGALKAAEAQIAGLEDVERVVSPCSVPVLEWKLGLPSVRPLVSGVPATAAEAGRIRTAASSSPLVRRNLLTEDGKTAVVLAAVKEVTLDRKRRLARQVREAVARLDPAGGEFHVAGILFLEVEIDRLTRRENAIFIPISFSMVVLMLRLLFRSWRVVALAVFTMLLCIAVSLAAFAALGRSFCLMTSLIPPLLLSIGIADSVHILVQVRQELASGAGKRAALAAAMAKMFRPCLYTGITTVAGFLSLVLTDVPPVREAGILGAGGIVFAFLLSFTLFPAALSLVDPAGLGRPGGRSVERAVQGGLSLSFRFARRHRNAVLLASAALLALSAAGILRLRPETHIVKFFRRDNPVRSEWAEIERRGVAIVSIEAVLRSAPGTFRKPETLEVVAAVQRRLESLPDVVRAVSAVDLLDHFAGTAADPAARRRARARVLSLAHSGFPGASGMLGGYVNADASAARIAVRVPGSGSEERLRMADRIREEAAAAAPGFAVEVNGAAPLFARVDRTIVEGQKRSGGAAGLAIFLMIVALLRSLRLGGIAMIPNVLPVLITLGLMGWTGIPLDVGTMVIAGVAVGIAVDDTIHFLVRYLEARRRSAGAEDAIGESHHDVGEATVFTSLILFFGFGIIGLSAFRPVAAFGLLTGLTMAVAILGDLVLLPALLLLRPERRPANPGGEHGAGT